MCHDPALADAAWMHALSARIVEQHPGRVEAVRKFWKLRNSSASSAAATAAAAAAALNKKEDGNGGEE